MGEELERVATNVVDSGLKVHRILGPGLLESAYEHCLSRELPVRGFSIGRQVWLPITYGGEKVEAAYKLDLIVENAIIVDVKAVESLNAVLSAQPLTYLRLVGCRIGFLMNVHVPLFKHGLKRFVL
jgi:GxxExxY protein